MRIPSGKTDQYIYFVALDSTDLVTRLTGLTTFTVYRSRNNGAATVYTTPTVAELSAANMPGLYALLIDEDTTIASGSDSEEYCVHITQASMAGVSRTIELYRRDTTSGKTLLVASSGALGAAAIEAASFAAGAIDAAAIATDALGALELAAGAATEIADAVWAAAARTLTALDEDSTTLDLDATIRAAMGLAAANLDTQLGDIDNFIDTEVAAIKAKTDQLTFTVANQVDANALTGGGGATAAEVADAVWDELKADHTVVDSFGDYLDDEITSRASQASVDDLPTNAELATALAGADDATLAAIAALNNLSQANVRTAVGLASANLDTQLSAIAGYIDTEIAAILAAVDTEVAAIKTQTDKMVFTVANQLDVNVLMIEGVDATDQLDAHGVSPGAVADAVWDALLVDHNDVDTFGAFVQAISGGGGPTAAEIADAVWDEDATGHQTQGSFGQAIGDPVADADTIWALVNANLNATVSSRATQTSVDDLPTNAELATALAGADDAVLAAIAALNNLSQANVRTAIGLASANLDTQLTAIAGYIDTEVAAILAAVDTEVAAIKAKTDQFVFTVANQVDANALSGGGSGLDAAGVRAAVGLASANLDTQLDALPTNAELATALAGADDAVLAQVALVKAKTDNLPSDPADASIVAGRFDTLDTAVAAKPTAAQITAAVFAQTLDGNTFLEHMRGLVAVAYGPWTKLAGVVTFRDAPNTKDRVSATIAATSRGVADLDLT